MAFFSLFAPKFTYGALVLLVSIWEVSAVNLQLCPPALISCECGVNTNQSVHFALAQCVNWIGFKGFQCKLCNRKTNEENCAAFKYCETCDGTLKTCTTCPSNRYGKLCENTCECLNGGKCLDAGKCECPPSHTGVKCEKPLVCPTLTAPVNGTVTFDSEYLKVGNVATFSCNEEFELNGLSTLYCLEGLIWSGKPPVCERICPSSSYRKPVNGYVQRTSEKTKVGSVIVYTCSSGYALIGSATRVCLENGTWSGKPPTCEKLVFCDEPTTPENSDRNIQSGIHGYFSRGTKITYTCKEDHKMIGNSTIVCLLSGKWSSKAPVCFAGTKCSDPGIPKHTERILHTSLKDQFLPGSSIEYHCDQLYYMVGNALIICQNGTWSSEPPACLKLTTCTEPDELPNGNFQVYSPDSVNGNIGRPNTAWRPLGRPVSPGGSIGLSLTRPSDDLLVESLEETDLNRTLQSLPDFVATFDNVASIDLNNTAEPLNITDIETLNVTIGDTLPMEMLDNTTEPIAEERTRTKRNAIPLPRGHHHIGSRATFACESRYYNLIGSHTRTCTSEGKWSGRPPTCIPVCGKSSSPVTPFITHGVPSAIGQWPWQVGIALQTSSEKWFIICGGSIVNERWVVTAAHCVTYERTTTAIPTEEFRLYFGKYYRNDSLDDSLVQIREVAEVVVHPDYEPRNYESDIALIKVVSPITLTSRVQPVCLPETHSDSSDLRLQEGNNGTLTGWGMKENGKFSAVLQYAVIPVVSSKKCEDDYRKAGIHLSITWNMFCGGYDKGKYDSCTGDSGGPLVFPYDEKKDRWVLEGIVSWGSSNGCGKAGQYGGYTRVQRFLEWIYNYINN